jgi:hypothetical protein
LPLKDSFAGLPGIPSKEFQPGYIFLIKTKNHREPVFLLSSSGGYVLPLKAKWLFPRCPENLIF